MPEETPTELPAVPSKPIGTLLHDCLVDLRIDELRHVASLIEARIQELLRDKAEYESRFQNPKPEAPRSRESGLPAPSEVCGNAAG